MTLIPTGGWRGSEGRVEGGQHSRNNKHTLAWHLLDYQMHPFHSILKIIESKSKMFIFIS